MAPSSGAQLPQLSSTQPHGTETLSGTHHAKAAHTNSKKPSAPQHPGSSGPQHPQPLKAYSIPPIASQPVQAHSIPRRLPSPRHPQQPPGALWPIPGPGHPAATTPPTCRPLPAACRRHARQPAALTAPRAAPATPRTAPARPPRRACREAPSAGAGLQLPAGSAPTLRARRGRANSRTAYGPALPPETNRVRTFCGRTPGNQDGASRSVLRPR